MSSINVNGRATRGGGEDSSFKRRRTGFALLGRLEVRRAKIVPCADRIADFAAYRRDERGLSPATIRNQCWQVEKFVA